MYKSALEISENLAKNNPKDYEQTLAQSYENLADLYEDTQRISESEEMYKSALAIYMHLAQENPQRYESNLAWSYNNLAIIYYNTQRYVESESMYKAALELFLHLYDINPQNWDFTLMNCYYWLGNTMIQIEKLNEAKEHLIKSLSLARQMTKDGNKYSIHWLSLYYLSAIHSQEKDYSSAYNNNEELLPILNAYYKDDAERWKANYSSQLVSQSFCAILLGKFKEGEQYSLEALKVDSTKQLAYTNLAAALLLQGKVVEAETLYIQYKAEFKKDFLSDFSEFERLGIVPEERKKDVERIKAMLIAYTPL